MVERKTKLTKLVLLDRPTSKATNAGIIARLSPLKKHVLTLTSYMAKSLLVMRKYAKDWVQVFIFARPIIAGSEA
jgi:hypothetical protein